MAQSADSRVDPHKAASLLAAAVQGDPTPLPTIPLPAAGVVRLPGGFVPDSLHPDLSFLDAQVRELTGADEEEIVRARRVSALRMTSTIIERGTETLGGHKATPEALKSLLIGDRETLLLEISRATYSEDLTFENYPCSGCGERLTVVFGLNEIPVRRLETSTDRDFEVPLRKGRKALVSLPTGADQDFVYAKADAESVSTAEANTLLLSRCVKAILAADGTVTPVAGSTSTVRALGLADRNAIIVEITDRQPGPRYDEASFTHEACGTEVPLPIGPGDLFPGM